MNKLTSLAIALMLASQVMAADDKVMLNFVNSDIESTVKAVGVITGKNFILDPRVKGTVNVVSASAVPRKDVFPILLSALRLQGFSVVESGSLVKIVPEADAKQNNSQTMARKMSASGDRIVTQVYPLHNESAAQLVPVLRPLITSNNSIAAYPNSNMLVITDYAENIRRLDDIIENIDQPATSELVTLPLKYASATEVTQTIAKLMPEVSVPGSGAVAPAISDGVRKTVLLADVRANVLLIRGENPAHLAQIRKIAESMDKQGASGGNIHVIYLKNADAPRLAATLKAILTGGDVPQSQNSAFTSVATAGNNAPGAGAAPAATPAPTPQPVSVPSSGGSSSSLPGVAIQADPTTNALIVTAPENIYANILSVIDKLDARRAQVYVEAMIAEVKIDKSGTLGVQWLVGGGDNKTANAVGLSNIGTTGNSLGDIAQAAIAKNPSNIPAGLMLGVVNGSLTNGGKTPNLGVIASALEANGNGNILSMPNLLTLDNEEASILVGQNIPIVTGTQSSTGANQNPFTTVDRKDIGIKLKVRPQISEGGAITMQVSQEVSSIDTNVSAGSNGFVTTKRSIDSKVLVDDGQIIVLGGLIEDKLTQNDNRVPLLGDIPVVGNLFRYQQRTSNRTNLMVFLRPVVLRDGKSSLALSTDRYRLLQDVQNDYHADKHVLLPNLPEVSLPTLDVRPGSPVTANAPAKKP
jgi:general secretion pathway protein D